MYLEHLKTWLTFLREQIATEATQNIKEYIHALVRALAAFQWNSRGKEYFLPHENGMKGMSQEQCHYQEYQSFYLSRPLFLIHVESKHEVMWEFLYHGRTSVYMFAFRFDFNSSALFQQQVAVHPSVTNLASLQSCMMNILTKQSSNCEIGSQLNLLWKRLGASRKSKRNESEKE